MDTKSFRQLSAAELRQEFDKADLELMQAIVAGCALVANADGWVAREERRRMSGLVRSIDPISAFGRDEVLAKFKELNALFVADHDKAERHAFTLVKAVRGKKIESELLLTVCSAVSSADGGLDEEERIILMKLCETLDLDPTLWGLRVGA